MVVKELFVMLGLDVNAASFAEGMVAAKGLEDAFGIIKDTVMEAIHGLEELVVGTAEARHEIGEMAIRTGVSTDAIQQLAYVSKFSGVSLDELGQSLNMMAKKGVKNVKEEFLKLADQIHDMPADGRRAELAMDKIGRAGGRMVPILARGREELEEMFGEAPVASKEAIEASTHFTETLMKIQGASKGIWKSLAGPLIDAINPILDQIRAWQKANQVLIKTKLKEWGEAAGRAIGFLWRRFVNLRDAVAWLYSALGPLIVLMASGLLAAIILNTAALWAQIVALAITASWYIALGIQAVTAAVAAAAAWVVAAAPFLLLTAILFMAYMLLEDLWYSITEGEGVLADFWAALMDTEAGFWLKGFFKSVKDFFIWLGGIGIGGIFSNAFTAWKDGFLGFFSWLWTQIKRIPGVEWALNKMSGGAPAAAAAASSAAPGASGNAAPMSPAKPETLFGGGASPAATASSGGMSSSRQLVYQPQVSNQFTITQQPGESGEVFARRVAAQDDGLQRHLNEAHAAVRQ